MTDVCMNDDVKEKAASVIKDFIKQKEMILREREEEFGSTPSKYVVANVIQGEIDVLKKDITSMKKLVNELCTKK